MLSAREREREGGKESILANGSLERLGKVSNWVVSQSEPEVRSPTWIYVKALKKTFSSEWDSGVTVYWDINRLVHNFIIFTSKPFFYFLYILCMT